MVNNELFDGTLTPPRQIKINNFRDGTLGWCKPFGNAKKSNRTVVIGISRTIDNLHNFLCILIHEMVHAWEWIILNKWNDKVLHGKAFYSWKETVHTRFGAPLRACYDVHKIDWYLPLT